MNVKKFDLSLTLAIALMGTSLTAGAEDKIYLKLNTLTASQIAELKNVTFLSPPYRIAWSLPNVRVDHIGVRPTNTQYVDIYVTVENAAPMAEVPGTAVLSAYTTVSVKRASGGMTAQTPIAVNTAIPVPIAPNASAPEQYVGTLVLPDGAWDYDIDVLAQANPELPDGRIALFESDLTDNSRRKICRVYGTNAQDHYLPDAFTGMQARNC